MRDITTADCLALRGAPRGGRVNREVATIKRAFTLAMRAGRRGVQRLLFVHNDNVLEALALGVRAGLRSGHRLAVGRNRKSAGDQRLTSDLARDLERSVVNTREGVRRIRH